MDPVTAFLAAGAVLGAAGAVAGGNASAANGRASANAAEAQAAIEQQRAQSAYQQGSAREESVRRNVRATLGAQFAAQAQSGIDPGSGSALLVRHQSAVAGELDALTTRYESDLTARGLMQQASFDRYGADNARLNARTAQQMGYLSAAGSIIGGVGDYMKFSEVKKLKGQGLG
jgi:hypothetical protein